MSATKDFFVSRAGADAETAAWIVRTLEGAGFSCSIQQRDFSLGAHFPLAIEEAFDRCRAVIAVLSPSYVASAYCRDEWSVAYAFHRKENGRRLLPVRVAAGRIPALAEALAYIDLVGVPQDEQAAKLLAGVRDFRQGRALSEGLAPDDTPLTNSTFDTPHFTAREAELAAVHEALWGEQGAAALSQPAAVHGFGGIGKSSIAREYARRHVHRYAGAWLVRAEHEETLLVDLAQLKARLDGDNADTADVRFAAEAGVAEARRLAAQTGKPFLLVFDNVENPADIPPWARGDHLHVLITSRYATWPSSVRSVEIEKLPLDAARALLLTASGRESGSEVDTLLAALAGLPLAIVQAGAYLRENPSESFAQYREALGRRLSDAPDDWPATQRLVAATYAPSLQLAEARAPGASAMLSCAAFFASENIPITLLAKDANDEKMRKAADALTRYSLWQRGEDCPWGPTRSVHRVLQTVLRTAMSQQEFKQRALACGDRLAFVSACPPGDVQKWPKLACLTSHAAALSAATPESAAGQGLAAALSTCGEYLMIRADFAGSEPMLRRALAIAEKAFGPDHTNTAGCLNNLAQLLQKTNRIAEAEPLMRRAVAIDEAFLGKDHVNLAVLLANLVQLLLMAGRLAEAEPLMRRALAINEARLGRGHVNVACDLNNLAELLRARGQPSEAEPLLRRALAIGEKKHGQSHPGVATYLNNLALLLGATNRLDEAERSLRRALDIDEAHFSADHPSVARDLNNLASLLQKQGRLAEAETMAERAALIFLTKLGADHPHAQTAAKRLEAIRAELSHGDKRAKHAPDKDPGAPAPRRPWTLRALFGWR